MTVDTLVSVVVPIYNIEAYLDKCVKSIIDQTYRNIEIILVDDGSTDRCASICGKYALLDMRVCVIHKANGGLVSARKAGVEAANGDYIINIDGDDWIEPDRIQNLVEKGFSTGADMVYMSGLRKDFEDRSVVCKTDVPCKTYIGNTISNELFPLFTDTSKCFKVILRHNLWMWAVKKELLQRNQRKVDDRIIMAEDQACVWYCLLEAESVAVIEENGYHYLQERKSAITNTLSDRYEEGMKILFSQMLDWIGQYKNNGKIREIWMWAFTLSVLYSSYGICLQSDIDFLFPYKKVRKGSKIAVYGAGKIGKSMIKALEKTENYQAVIWVDRKVRQSPLPKYQIETVEKLLDCDFDYVVVAVADADMAEEINMELIELGIEKSKIAIMDVDAIDERILLRMLG